MDNGEQAARSDSRRRSRSCSRSIIEGILGGKLEWGLVVIGVLIAVALELAGVSALPFAVGMYLPLSASTPIFVGGMLRWLADRCAASPASEAEAETSPGVLLSSGYIAGGTLCGLIIALLRVPAGAFNKALDLGRHISARITPTETPTAKIVCRWSTFLVLAVDVALRRHAAAAESNAPDTDDPFS